MSAALLTDPAILAASILGALGFAGAVVNARATHRTERIMRGNGHGNVAEMTEFILDEVRYIRTRVDSHIEDETRHVAAPSA